jgi:hypothetical protein
MEILPEVDLVVLDRMLPGIDGLTREELLSAVWGYGHDPGTNVVQVYIGYGSKGWSRRCWRWRASTRESDRRCARSTRSPS